MTRRRRNINHSEFLTEALDAMPAVKLLFLTALISCALLALGVGTSAAAGVETRLETGSFNGADTTAGAFEDVKRMDIHQSTGTLYVIDARGNFSTGVVDKFNENGVAENFSALGRSTLSGADVVPPAGLQTELESDIAVDNNAGLNNGRIYLLSQGGNAFFAFAPTGAFLYKTTVGTGEPKICGIGVDTGGNVWVGDGALHTVRQFTSAGAPTGKVIATKHEACSIVFDSANNMYVGGRGWEPLLVLEEGLIEKYDPAGNFTAQFDAEKYTDFAINPPTDSILAADNNSNTVREFSSTGTLIADYPRVGAIGIAVNGAKNNVYVSDETAQRIRIYGPPQLLPKVNTEAPTDVEPREATLHGTVRPEEVALTDCSFEYIGDVDFESTGGWSSPSVETAPCTPSTIPDVGPTAVSATVTRPDITDADVAAGDTEAMHFRLAAKNPNGPGYGYERVVGFGITDFDGEVLKQNGEPDTQAGGHPYLATQPWHINKFFKPSGQLATSEAIKNVTVDLPPGFIGNPQALPTCPIADFAVSPSQSCPVESIVGVIRLQIVGAEEPYGGGQDENGNPVTPGQHATSRIPLYNLKAPNGVVGLLGFSIANFPNYVTVRVRSGTDYGLTFEAINAVQSVFFNLSGTIFDVWGVPGDSSHDSERYSFTSPTNPYKGTPTAFLTAPTSCIGPIESRIRVETWEGTEDLANSFSHDDTKPVPNPIGTEGCNTLDFSPSLEARPTTNVAASPTGLSVDLSVPQSDITNPASTAEAHLRDAVLTLPEGLVVNPSGANGLGTCSTSEVGLTSGLGQSPLTFTEDAATCPENSRIGSVEIETPVLDHPLPGGLFVATPYDNPFESLLALYLMVRDPQSGLVVKLAGEVELDPSTGRLTVTFNESPQLPFSHLRLNVFGGSSAPLRTPETCGIFSTTSSLTPWSAPDSGPPATPSDVYAIEQGAVGGTCPSSLGERQNAPSFDAGTESPLAGKTSPLVINLRRQDGSQQFSAVNLSPPPGLLGKLAGVPNCPDSALAAASARTGAEEKAAPSCPAASDLGAVTAAAGAGPAPYYASGRAYLAGPYKGAPLSVAIVTPAVAGPFDLGTIVVRAALHIDPVTARLTALTDPIPSILKGIPLDIQSVQIRLDRPDFTRNPTSCNPLSFDGQLISVLGQAAPLTSRFQLGECGRLGFLPKMTLALKGATGRTGHPALTATITAREGDANIASFSFALPPQELIDNAHFRDICTRAQFAADKCPASSAYGSATVTTPILDYPLSGPIYLRSSSHPLPDAVADLRGPASQPIKLEGAARVDTFRKGLRSTVDVVPDAPVSKIVFELKGGKKGLFQNSRDLCAKRLHATVKFRAHNGLQLTRRPTLQVQCGQKKRKRQSRKPDKRPSNRRAHR